ncbi:acyltransferase family protein [Polynucleobacter brandtiae]|uniref:Peptidoglycan/LPS O-acetylase OafA/YrhL n=1 Tax=Polynucleobacter brandtiae TaxID=1938816 RepID=A0A2M8VQZ3_9BURK|nr:acyltransferase [Polynucleobacter brandtiae]PJI79892.1 peptidoglycan/LPS O-acetylase OafA/YrhL [Polynucleobacter brandtiae]
MQSKNHFLLIDFLKLFAALLIILHHFSSYGQLAEDAKSLLPGLMGFLFDYGRYAVQIFLVMGGYLAAQSLSSQTNLRNPRALLKLIFNRYLRLFTPYLVALLLTICCAWIARFWVQDEFVGESETLGQLLAHLFFLQGILGLDSISAGAWYVAIDWQLFSILAILMGLLPNSRSLIWVATGLAVTSLLYFNRHSEYENYFIYFIGSYGLGVLAYLAKNQGDAVGSPTVDTIVTCLAQGLFGLIGVVILISSLQDLWIRNCLAYFVALALIIWGSRAYKDEKHARFHTAVLTILWGSRRSYCAFLVHFAFILLANTIYIAWGMHTHHDGLVALTLMLVAVVLSWVAANYLYQLVEIPSRKLKLKLKL